MSAGAESSPDQVDLWLHEHDEPDSGGWSGSGLLPRESILGVLFLVWGMVLLVVTVLDLVLGWMFVLIFPELLGWWLVALALGAIGSWFASELSNDEGFEATREHVPIP
jgi:hypothetical protein